MVTFRRILVGWNGSDAGRAALHMVTSYADTMGASIEVLVVFEGPDAVTPEVVWPGNWPEHERSPHVSEPSSKTCTSPSTRSRARRMQGRSSHGTPENGASI